MKKITVTLSDKAEAYFDEIMYSLPKYADGSGMCTQSQAINYALVSLQAAEKKWENEKEPQQPSEGECIHERTYSQGPHRAVVCEDCGEEL